MKKIAFLCCLVFLCFSCKKVKELTTFKIRNSSNFTAPATGSTGIALIDNRDVASSASQEFKNNNTQADHVQEIKLEKLTLTILTPPTQNFNFLKDLRIYIQAGSLPEKELAYIVGHGNDNATSIELTPTGDKLDDYVKSDSYKLRFAMVTDEPIISDTEIRSDLVFSVHAKVL